MESSYNFSEDEIREQLEKFGFHHIPGDRLKEFKKDLDTLINSERALLAAEARQNMSYTSDSTHSPDGPSRCVAPRYPYRPTIQSNAPPTLNPDQSENTVTVHVTGIDPRMRKVHAAATYREKNERLTRSAPTSPSKSMTESDYERKTIKRKVVRRVNGESFIDESFIESESDDAGSLVCGDGVRARTARTGQPFCDVENRDVRRAVSAGNQPPRYFFEDPHVKSVIYPMAEQPHSKNVRRCDPVTRFHEFNKYWEANKIPGEKTHKSLRWSVRENMLFSDPIRKKPQQKMVVNEYVVPTEKKRMALRWQVRAQLAEGQIPGSGYASN